MAIRPWSRKQILYVIIMHMLLVSSSLAALITLEIDPYICAAIEFLFYINAVFKGPQAPDDPRSSIPGFFLIECVSHIFGLGLVVFLLNMTSPMLALCVGILSSTLCFIALCACVCDWLWISKKTIVVNDAGIIHSS